MWSPEGQNNQIRCALAVQVAPLARVAGPIVAAAISWVTPCGSSRSRHLHVLHTLTVTSAASILSSIAFFLQTSKWFSETLTSSLWRSWFPQSNYSMVLVSCTLSLAVNPKFVQKLNALLVTFVLSRLDTSFFSILDYSGCYFDFSNLNLCLVCHMNSSYVTSLMLTCELRILRGCRMASRLVKAPAVQARRTFAAQVKTSLLLTGFFCWLKKAKNCKKGARKWNDEFQFLTGCCGTDWARTGEGRTSENIHCQGEDAPDLSTQCNTDIRPRWQGGTYHSIQGGLTVASIENHAPVTTLGVVIKVTLWFGHGVQSCIVYHEQN